MRIMDLENWPPEGAGPVDDVECIRLSADKVLINLVLQVSRNRVIFSCLSNGRTMIYLLSVADVPMAMKVKQILSDNRGKPLLSIGAVEVPNVGE